MTFDPQVLRLQLLLATRGLYHGPLDGLYGPLTDAAIRATGASNECDALRAAQAMPALFQELRAVHIPLKLVEAKTALEEAFAEGFGHASPNAVRVALAQLALEHGRTDNGLELKAVWCLNLGNLMTGHDWTGPWFWATRVEVVNNVKTLRHSQWRAFGTPAEATRGYWSRLKGLWPHALPFFETGDAAGVADALKHNPGGEYYTGDEATYAADLVALMRELPA